MREEMEKQPRVREIWRRNGNQSGLGYSRRAVRVDEEDRQTLLSIFPSFTLERSTEKALEQHPPPTTEPRMKKLAIIQTFRLNFSIDTPRTSTSQKYWGRDCQVSSWWADCRNRRRLCNFCIKVDSEESINFLLTTSSLKSLSSLNLVMILFIFNCIRWKCMTVTSLSMQIR